MAAERSQGQCVNPLRLFVFIFSWIASFFSLRSAASRRRASSDFVPDHLEQVRIGVLALQGGFAAHAKKLTQLGVEVIWVRTPDALESCHGLIIPGGESTTLLNLMQPHEDWFQALRAFHAAKKPIFGTCAGAILLARQVEPKQSSLGLIDIHVKRNAYGRQLDSFITRATEASPELGDSSLEAVFIRAPQVVEVGEGVRVLLHYKEQPILLEQGNVLVATFHPELSESTCIHRYFVTRCQAGLY